uniref:Uncharacterized protein n=1 Tax=Aegilops tauschii TaxID=37682 RepID=R7W6Y6_AEGTA
MSSLTGKDQINAFLEVYQQIEDNATHTPSFLRIIRRAKLEQKKSWGNDTAKPGRTKRKHVHLLSNMLSVISTNNPYDMNLKLIFADILQKSIALLGFAAISRACCAEKFDWLITGFSLSTLPNTLIVGIPLLKGMYGDEAVKLISQIVVLQSLIWYTLLLFLLEFRAAKGIAAAPSSEIVGLFTALQTKIIACGTKKMLVSLGIRFFLGPALMMISSYAVGMRGILLKVAIVQAALPQGVVPFVFAKEYNVHADILSTAIIVGMMVAVPAALAYYFVI